MKAIISEWENIIPLILNKENVSAYITKYDYRTQGFLKPDEIIAYIDASRRIEMDSPLDDNDKKRSAESLLEEHFNDTYLYSIVIVKAKDGNLYFKEIFDDLTNDEFDDIIDILMSCEKSKEVAVTATMTPALKTMTKPPFIK